MESDSEDRARNEEMNKLRSGSSSPSALSTASSGSPLVRNSSGSSNKRSVTNPTSIAAAQLQRQQLELNNRLMDEAKRAGSKQGRALLRNQQSSTVSASGYQVCEPSRQRSGGDISQPIGPNRKLKEDGFKSEKGKSPGYSMAKSIAFQACRFNEFWSINKIKYLNLACLLMTIICLATIITLSGNSNLSSRQSDSAKSELPASESLVSSVSLDGSVSRQASSPAAEQQFDSLEDDFDSHGTATTASPGLRRRKSEPTTGEREVEETTPAPDSTDVLGSSPFGSPGPFGPFLNQILGDMDVGGLIKSLRRNSSSEKPFVQKRITKNGATIIISSGALNNSAETSSLLEKLLPPFLRPLTGSARSSQNGTLASATITMSAEPIFALSSGGSGRQFDFLPASPALDQPRMLAFSSSHSRPSMFDAPMNFQSNMFPTFFGPPSASPIFNQGGLLGMMMRASELESQNESQNELKSSGSSLNMEHLDGSQKSNASHRTQTSQPQNSTLDSVSRTKSTVNNSSSPESDVELVDLMQMIKSSGRRFGPRVRQQQMLPGGGSLMLFSSAGAGPIEPPALPSMFMPEIRVSAAPMNPQVMFFGSGMDPSPSLQSGPLNPILRTVLSNVLSELSDSDKNKTDRLKSRSSGASSSTWPFLPGGVELDSSQSDETIASNNDRWDDRQLKAKHRSSADDDSDQSFVDSRDLLNGLQFDQTPSLTSVLERQLGSGASGIVSGTIRQTIRGPGMTVERIIEVPPSASAGRIQQVGAGIKSQSLSRLSESDSNIAPRFERPTERGSSLSSSGSLFGSIRPVQMSDRSDSGMARPNLGFIGRLLSDLGQRTDQMSARLSPFEMMRARMSSGDDLDEADSNLEMPLHSRPSSNWPNVHLGGARIRIRPVSEPLSSSGDSFLMPPTHLTILEENDEPSESHGVGHIASPAMLTVNDGKQLQGPGFQETLSSVEDRLNNVLSLVSQDSALRKPDYKSPDDQQVQQETGKPSDSSDQLNQHQQQKAKQINSSQEPIQAPSLSSAARIERVDMKQVAQERLNRQDNPFTSPSSPLFGFPSSPLAAGNNIAYDRPGQQAGSQQPVPAKPIAAFSARSLQPQPVKVHYTESAPSQPTSASDAVKASDQLASESSQERVSTKPPAMTVLGRRMDDSPVQGPDFQQQSFNSFQEEYDQTGMESRSNSFRVLKPNSSPGLTSSSGQQASANNRPNSIMAKHRTIVVE